MHFFCDKDKLKTALDLVHRIIPSKPMLPVCGNVSFLANQETQSITLRAFDTTIEISAAIAAEVKAPGEILLAGNLVHELVANFPSSEIELEVKDNSAFWKCGSSKFKLPFCSETLPNFPQPIAKPFTISAAILSSALKTTTFICPTDDPRENLNGVNFKIVDNHFICIATDGHRLAYYKANLKEDLTQPLDKSITVPYKTFKEVERYLISIKNSIADRDLELTYQDNLIAIADKTGNYEITSRIIDKPFPSVESLIPKTFSTTLKCDRADLINSLMLINVIARSLNVLLIEIDAKNQVILLKTECQDVGSGDREIVAEIEGESLNVSLRLSYFIEILRNLKGKQVIICLNEPRTPVILKGDADTNDSVQLIMPVKIRA